jgi:hypothetical protein
MVFLFNSFAHHALHATTPDQQQQVNDDGLVADMEKKMHISSENTEATAITTADS